MAMAAATARIIEVPTRSLEKNYNVGRRHIQFPPLPLRIDEKASSRLLFTSLHLVLRPQKSTPHPFHVVSCLPSPSFSKTTFNPSTKLFVSGLSFHTTEDSLRNAFKRFGQLLEVNLVMDNIANRPKGFAFVRYATEEESQKAIEGMNGTFLDGRVIFVEVAKSRTELRQSLKQNHRPS